MGRLILDFEFFRALYPNNTVKSEQRDWHALEPILRRCRGVRVLSIGGWGWGHQDRLEFDWMSLSGPGWAGESTIETLVTGPYSCPLASLDLKSLEFKYNESLPSSPTDTISFPFSLTTLRILQGPTGSPSEATALALCQSSITSLEISHQDTRQTLFNIFLPVAPQFTSLVIGPWSHGETDAVDHFLKNCTQLKNLRLSGLATKWQDHLVVPLEEFWFCALAADELDDLAIILVSSSIALSQLKRLFFEPDADTHWEEEDEVKRVCEEKGITSFWVEGMSSPLPSTNSTDVSRPRHSRVAEIERVGSSAFRETWNVCVWYPHE